MNNNDESLDLLDLEDEQGFDSLPAANPFNSPRPKKPWLLLGIGLLVIALATYIIIKTVGSDSGSSVEIDLDTPETVTVDPNAAVTPDTIVVPAQPVQPAQPTPVVVTPAKPVVAAPAQKPTAGVPERVVADRGTVTFSPDKPATTKPVVAAPVAKPKPAAATVKPKTSTAVPGAWYVQFGSYSTRAAAESAQKKITAKHASLLGGKQFVILAAQLPNGTTTYRLRIAFASSHDASGFCGNAKSDGLDCYVAK